jgi:hypothetical protein
MIVGLTSASIWAGGCGADVPEQELPTKIIGPATTAEQLFALDRLPKFYLTIDDDAWADLEAEPKEYTVGTFEYAGEVHENVGVRLKGNLTLTELDDKPPFKVKFNKWEKGRRFLGLETLTLHNMWADASMLREHVAYRIFREMGVPASRTGYAELVVNGEDYGVYLNLETLDDEFLEHNYDDASGNLYEGEHGDDVDKNPANWEQDEGSDESREDLVALGDLATQDNLDIFFASDTMLDTERFLAFTATEHAVGHFDGYMLSHNFFVYHELASDEWTWIPWSLDQTLARRSSPFEGEGYLTRKCLDADECLEVYIPVAQQIPDLIESLDLHGEVDEVLELIDEAARGDDAKHHSNDGMEGGQAAIRRWIDERPDQLREALDCLEDGQHADHDDDGWGPCFADCDDENGDVHPEAAEVCDGVDNDCSGDIDDDPTCECPSAVVDGRTFYFCTHHKTWSEARSFCWAQDHALAAFESREQNDEVYALAHEIKGGKWSIGLNDREDEGVYEWLDGTTPSFEAWADGEPAHLLEWFDCVFFKGGSSATWVERNCIETASFICADND